MSDPETARRAARTAAYSFRVFSAPSADWLDKVIQGSGLKVEKVRPRRQNILEVWVRGDIVEVHRIIGEIREAKKRIEG